MVNKKPKKAEPKKSSVSQKTKKEKIIIEPESKENKSFFSDASKNIETGVEVAGEKLSEIAGKTAETAGELFKAVKKGFSSTYETSVKVLDELSHTAQGYIEKFKQNVEMKKLTDELDTLTKKLGLVFFSEFKFQKEGIFQSATNNKDIMDLIAEIDKLNKKIVKIGKKIENKK